MEVPITERRIQIQTLEEAEDWDGIQKLGIKMVEGPGLLDCGGYVLRKIGPFPARPEFMQVIWDAPRDAQPHAGIILYRKHEGRTVQQHGLYDGKKVISKWGHGPVFEHGIADVPQEYGDIAEFVVVDDNLKNRIREVIMRQHFGPENY